jgi:protocatechuate 3,4-dioxygenase beta subunit
MKALLLLFTAALMAQTPQRPTGTVSGRVTDADSGAPVSNFPISGSHTDAEGRYTITLPAGPARIALLGDRIWPELAIANVTVTAEKNLSDVDFRIRPDGEISGRVIDEDKDPIAGMPVHIIGREYYAGALRYFTEGRTVTNDRGEYRLRNIRAGRAVFVLAEPVKIHDVPLSPAPAEPNLRIPANRATFYPNSDSLEGAVPQTLRSHEHREGLDIQVKRTPAYCISAVLLADGVPASLNYQITDENTSSSIPVPGSGGSGPPGTPSGPDGRIRLCGLYPSRYRITAFRRQGTAPELFGAAHVDVSKEDVKNVRISAQHPFSIKTEVAWISDPPDPSIAAQFAVVPKTVSNDVLLLGRAPRTAVPGELTFDALQDVEYHLQPLFTPAGALPNAYLQSVTYGPANLLYLPFQAGASGDVPLRMILGNDGGFIKVTAAINGVPASNAKVLIIPASVPSAAVLPDAMVTLEPGADGTATSHVLAPGRYYVLATSELLDNTPESIDAIWRARSRGVPADVAARTTASVTVEPKALLRP